MKLDCAVCASRVKARRGSRHYESLGGAPVLHWVLMLPSIWREQLSPERVHAIRPLVAALIGEWFLQVRGVEVGSLVSFHPTGSKCAREGCTYEGPALALEGACPDCGEPAPWLPHYDVVIPAAGVRRGVALTFPAFMPEELLQEWRKAWRLFLERMGRELGLEGDPAPVCWAGYQHKPEKIHHTIAYSGRPFPAFYEAMPRGLRTPQRYGLLAPGALRTRDEDRQRAIRRYREIVAGHLDKGALTCPDCDAELVLTSCVGTEKLPILRWNGARDLDSEGTRGPPVTPHRSRAWETAERLVP